MPSLSVSSLVLATLQSNLAGVSIRAAAAKPEAGTMVIYLNKAVAGSTNVACFALDWREIGSPLPWRAPRDPADLANEAWGQTGNAEANAVVPVRNRRGLNRSMSTEPLGVQRRPR